MDEERRTKIASALQQYRETVLQHNIFLLRILVECMEEEPLPPQINASGAEQLHVREIGRFLQCPIPESVKSPRDILNDDVRAEVIRRARLDGVALGPGPVNLEQREEYFAGIKTHIAEKNVEVAEFPPADLEYLCTLVSGVTGPGLGNHHYSQQIEFVCCIEEHRLEDMVKSVTVPIRGDEGGGYTEWSDIWTDWEIAIAFKIGGGNFAIGGSSVLYCRNKDNEQWKWRYGVYDGDWCSDVYDSVEEFLGFYAHFRESTEEQVRKGIRPLKGILRLR
jgi:hypothetical protein